MVEAIQNYWDHRRMMELLTLTSRLDRTDIDSRCGFSLIEILAVLAIVVILVGLTLGLATGVFSEKAETRAEADLMLIAQSLERYRAKAGDYPWVGVPPVEGNRPNGKGINALIRSLMGFRAVDPARPQLRVGGDFIQANLLDFGASGYNADSGTDPGPAFPVDPWGNPYVYVYNPTYPKSSSQWTLPGYILLSAGPDGWVSLPGDVLQTGQVDRESYAADPVNGDNLVSRM